MCFFNVLDCIIFQHLRLNRSICWLWARWGSMGFQFFFKVIFFNVLMAMYGFSSLLGVCFFSLRARTMWISQFRRLCTFQSLGWYAIFQSLGYYKIFQYFEGWVDFVSLGLYIDKCGFSIRSLCGFLILEGYASLKSLAWYAFSTFY